MHHCVRRMPLRDMCVMPRFFMTAGVIVLGRLTVVSRRVLMVLCRRCVMLSAFVACHFNLR